MTSPPQTNSLVLYRRLLTYVLPYKWAFAAALVGMLLVAAGDTGFAWIMQPLMDQGFVQRDPVYIAWIPVLLILIASMRAIGNFVDAYCMTWVARKVVQDLRQKMFERLIYSPAQFFDHHASGSLVSRLTYDVEQVASASSSAFRVLFRDLIKALLLLGLMFHLSWKLSLIFILILPLALLVFKFTSGKFRIISSRIQESVGELTHLARQAVSGHRLIKIFSAYEQESGAFFRANNRNRQQSMKKAAILAASVPLIVFIMGLGVAGIIWLALLLEIKPGVFTSYLVAITMMARPVRNLSKINEVIQTGMAGAESIFRTLDQEIEADNGSVTLDNVSGEVRFDNVSFNYPGNDVTVLSGVTFDIPAGSTVALVGPSGSGKSTIASILMRFYSPNSGSVSIDRRPLQEITLQSLRRHIAVVSQEVILFDDTIRNNITYGDAGKTHNHNNNNDDNETRLQMALDAARVHEFVESLPHKLETMVGESGVRLSGGQRQRIAIARALYKDAPLLILDEATSSLDAGSEQFIQQAIDNLIMDRTTLVIAHRLSTIKSADMILVLDHGKIVEQGNHNQLIAKNGVYFNLYNTQFSEPSHVV